MKSYYAGSAFILAITFGFGLHPRQPKSLFNGRNLFGWDTYIGPAFDSASNHFKGDPLGLNVDPSKVFSVVQTDGKAAIRISGERFGGISTKTPFENYHLRLEFKWGKLKWNPKKKNPRDSGILYHAVGPHGADGNFWKRSHEFQIQEGDCGDYWGVAGGTADIAATKRSDMGFVYDPLGPILNFSDKSEIGRHCIKNANGEKPSGEWNTIDLYCMGDTSVHLVNNMVSMVLYNLGQQEGGHTLPLSKGEIQLQSEGAEIFYRDITIENIERIPPRLLMH